MSLPAPAAERPLAQLMPDLLAQPSAARPALSVVSTMYRSRGFLDEFLAQTLQAVQALAVPSFEIVLVNDGSPDDSLAHARQCQSRIAELVVVDLSRNFGHHNAMQAGLQLCRGERVFLIDCDLEVSPATLLQFDEKLSNSGADIVFGYQQMRKGGWFEQWSGALFWKGFNALSDTKIPENILTERLMTRRFVDALLSLGDHNVFLGGMMSWTGFSQVGLPVAKRQREGRSTYTLLKRLQLMVNAVSSFSAKPLVWLFNFGTFITLLSFSYAAYLVFRKLFFGDALLGFTSVMALMAITLGILTTALGLIGIYLGKVFNQVQHRPTYIVRDIHRCRQDP